MKKFVIISLLIFSITCNSIACFASDDFDYGVNKTADAFSDFIVTYEDDDGNLLNTTTFDFVPLLNKTITVPAKKGISALVKSFCDITSSGYDFTMAFLSTFCGEDSNYSFVINAGDESLTTNSINGSVLIGGIPEGEFSAHITNNNAKELSCNTFLLGTGLDTTPEKGFDMNLTCYDSSKTSMGSWLKPSIGVLGSAVFATLLRCLKF